MTYQVKCSAFEHPITLTADIYNRSSIYKEVGSLATQMIRSHLDAVIVIVDEKDTENQNPLYKITIESNKPL